MYLVSTFMCELEQEQSKLHSENIEFSFCEKEQKYFLAYLLGTD